jgi:hypothetical protein
MPRLDQTTIRNTQILFEKIKVFTIEQIVSSLSCSIPTARLKLKQWQAYTSYNKNGRYYTLPSVPKFDQNDIWCFKGICFSKFGNLKKTVVHLVNDSGGGLTGKQLGDILGLLPRSFPHHFKSTPGIRREKHGGVYVYFSDVPQTYQNQIKHRAAKNHIGMHPRRLSKQDAVIILASIIRHHGIGLEDILALPEIKQRALSSMAIQDFMETHGLLKKTPDPPP